MIKWMYVAMVLVMVGCGGADEQPALDCVGMEHCANDCDWDVDCINASCVTETDQKSLDTWKAIYRCSDAEGCETTECVDERCAAELQECQAD